MASCCPPTRPSAAGWATPSASTRPASVIDLLRALRAGGLPGGRLPGRRRRLMAELADGLTYDADAHPGPGRGRRRRDSRPRRYAQWFAGLPERATARR